MIVIGSKEWKETIKTRSKKQYSLLKDYYQRMPDQMPERRKVLAEVKIFAGIHNQNRALFEKGLRNWKTSTMACFDELENDETEDLTLSLYGEEVFEYHHKREGALFALGEHIKNKRNDYEEIAKQLDEQMTWWV